MAEYLNACRFNPTAGGTTDWTYSSAVTGYQSPAAAGVVNTTVYRYRAESGDLAQWEIGYGAYNTATGVLARTTVLSNSSGGTSKINFTATPQVAIVALAEDLPSLSKALNVFSGNMAISGTLNYGGVTLTGNVTGTGKMVLDTGPVMSNPVVGTQTQGDGSTKAASTAYADLVRENPRVLSVANTASNINLANVDVVVYTGIGACLISSFTNVVPNKLYGFYNLSASNFTLQRTDSHWPSSANVVLGTYGCILALGTSSIALLGIGPTING